MEGLFGTRAPRVNFFGNSDPQKILLEGGISFLSFVIDWPSCPSKNLKAPLNKTRKGSREIFWRKSSRFSVFNQFSCVESPNESQFFGDLLSIPSNHELGFINDEINSEATDSVRSCRSYIFISGRVLQIYRPTQSRKMHFSSAKEAPF